MGIDSSRYRKGPWIQVYLLGIRIVMFNKNVRYFSLDQVVEQLSKIGNKVWL